MMAAFIPPLGCYDTLSLPEKSAFASWQVSLILDYRNQVSRLNEVERQLQPGTHCLIQAAFKPDGFGWFHISLRVFACLAQLVWPGGKAIHAL